VSGARADRRELNKLLAGLEAGDVVVVARIDRLARSTFDLFAIVKSIVDRKAQFRSLAEPWADTSTSSGRLMIAVLGGLADVERDLIRTRTSEGRERAKTRGVKLGEEERRARRLGLLLIIVAHPRIMRDDARPGLYDISGSNQWWAKADHGVIIYRPDAASNLVSLTVAKCKDQETMGKPGEVALQFLRDHCDFRFVPRLVGQDAGTAPMPA
jgi:hypothetical protein